MSPLRSSYIKKVAIITYFTGWTIGGCLIKNGHAHAGPKAEGLGLKTCVTIYRFLNVKPLDTINI